MHYPHSIIFTLLFFFCFVFFFLFVCFSHRYQKSCFKSALMSQIEKEYSCPWRKSLFSCRQRAVVSIFFTSGKLLRFTFTHSLAHSLITRISCSTCVLEAPEISASSKLARHSSTGLFIFHTHTHIHTHTHTRTHAVLLGLSHCLSNTFIVSFSVTTLKIIIIVVHTLLQSHTRRMFARKSYLERRRFFKANEGHVIRLQAHWRGAFLV